MSVVQPLPAGLDLRLAQARGTGHLGRRGRAAEVDEARVRQVQQRDIVVIHPYPVSYPASPP